MSVIAPGYVPTNVSGPIISHAAPSPGTLPLPGTTTTGIDGTESEPVRPSSNSTWIRQQQLFGVALRSTGSRLPANAATVSVPAAAPPPPTPIILYEANQSTHSLAIVCFARKHNILIERRLVNPMLGRNGTKSDEIDTLPRIDDGGSIVHGWITILKYLAWKCLPKDSNTFYPMVNAATFKTPSTTSTTPTPPSAFTIDSLLDSFTTFQPTLDYLTHTFIQSAARGGHQGVLPYLRHTFDRDGGLLVPQWQQHQQPSSGKHHHAIPNVAAGHHQHGHAHGHAAQTKSSTSHTPSERDSIQYVLERHMRELRGLLTQVQSLLAKRNPIWTVERTLVLLRGTDVPEPGMEPTRTPAVSTVGPTPSTGPAPLSTAVKASTADGEKAAVSTATPAANASPPYAVSSSPPIEADQEFIYILGTRTPTLVDFVLFFHLHSLALVRSFLPLFTPQLHAPLFVFGSRMAKWLGGEILEEVLGLKPGSHILLERHMLLRAHLPPRAIEKRPRKDSEDENDEGDTVGPLSISVEPASSPSSSLPSLSSSPPPPNATATLASPPSRAVPRLTNVNALHPSATDSTRTSASSLAVEDVPDLMEYVEKIAVRARAATPATLEQPNSNGGGTTAPGTSPPGTPAPSASPVTPATASPSVPSAPALSSSKKFSPPTPSLTLVRPLSQKLLDCVDYLALGWKLTGERSGVKLYTPIVPPLSAEAPSATGEPQCYRSMAVATFPLSAPVLLSFLWSMDCYKLLDPTLVMDSRELAPHSGSGNSKYSYLSLEMKSSSNASNSTRRETVDAPTASPNGPTAANIIPAFASVTPSAPITKVSTARFDFLLLNSWTRLLDGTYILLHQSVLEDEINAPRKWTKGCIRASMGGGLSSSPLEGGVSGWVLKPCYQDGQGPCVQVSFVSCTEFPARMGSWIAGELERRTQATVVALRSKMKTLMGAHPLVQLTGLATPEQRGHAHTLHIRLSQAVSPAMVNAVSAHGVQSAPHPKVKG